MNISGKILESNFRLCSDSVAPKSWTSGIWKKIWLFFLSWLDLQGWASFWNSIRTTETQTNILHIICKEFKNNLLKTVPLPSLSNPTFYASNNFAKFWNFCKISSRWRWIEIRQTYKTFIFYALLTGSNHKFRKYKFWLQICQLIRLFLMNKTITNKQTRLVLIG